MSLHIKHELTYVQSSRSGGSHKQTAKLRAAMTKPCLKLNHFHKQPALVTDTFSASSGSLPTGASIAFIWANNVPWMIKLKRISFCVALVRKQSDRGTGIYLFF